MNRRRFLVSTAGVTTAAIGMPWLAAAGAATDAGHASAEPFPVAVDLETASTALEAYLG